MMLEYSSLGVENPEQKAALRAEVWRLFDEVAPSGYSLMSLLTDGVDVEAYNAKDVQRYGDGSILTAEMTAGMLNVYGSFKCLYEERRTFPFLKSIKGRVEQLESMREGGIEVVDFGCGSVPVMGIMAALSSDRVRVTCVEMNEVSAEMAREIIEKRGLSDQVTVVVGDARAYKHSSKIDLRISETMFAGLMDEPLVDIFEKTHDQMADDGFSIPHRIVVEASISLVGYAPFDFTLPQQNVPVFTYFPGYFRGGDQAICFRLSLEEFENFYRGRRHQLRLGCRVELDDGGNVIAGDDSIISKAFDAAEPFVIGLDNRVLNVFYIAGTHTKLVSIEVV